MATVTRIMLICDVCGNAKDVHSWTFGLDGKTYEVDLCPDDGKGLSKVTAGFALHARKVRARHSQQLDGHSPRPKAATAPARNGARAGMNTSGRARAAGSAQEHSKAGRSGPQAAKVSGAKVKTTGAGEHKASRRRPPKAEAASRQTAKATGVQQRNGIYVYGILPDDVEVADQMPGVGEPAGPLRAVHSHGLAALISDVGQPALLGSPDDLRAHREILDATAAEVPVLPLRFGMVLASEDAVAEFLAAHHDEFAAALEQLEGRAEFLVKGRYLQQAAPGEDLAKNTHPTARKEDIQALQRAMEGICVTSVVHQPAHELDLGDAAFLVAVDQKSEVKQVIANLAREWEGRIEVQLLGPMAARDFVGTANPED